MRFRSKANNTLISLRPVDPGRSSFMFGWRLLVMASTSGRPSAGAASRSTLTAASSASASDCSSPSAQASHAGWNSTDHDPAIR